MGHKSTEKYNDICTLKHNLLHYVMGQTSAGMSGNPAEVAVLGEYIDMIKDLAEAEKECQEACYYETVVEAMESDSYDEGRMGYNRKRNRLGQYSDGRGMGDSGSNQRMGYIPDMNRPYKRMMDETDWDEDEPAYGKSFNRFRKAKRHYTKTHSEEDKQKMKDASNAHMMETMATLREIWDDADPDLRKRMKTDLTNLTASLT